MRLKATVTACLLLASALVSTSHGADVESSVASSENNREDRAFIGSTVPQQSVYQPQSYPQPQPPRYPQPQPTYPQPQPTYTQPQPTYPVKPVQPKYPPPPRYPAPARYPTQPKYPSQPTYPVPPVVQPRVCQTPYVQGGCPYDQVCSADYRCVPLKPTGSRCSSEFECLSGKCRESRCVHDECLGEGFNSGCPAGQECVQTRSGRVCRPRDDSCRPKMSPGGCPGGSYCGQEGRCTPLLDVDAPCWSGVQCLHHVCRGHVCKLDACPQLDSDQDCPVGQFCSSSQRGNICINRRADGEACSSDAQCQSYRCTGHRCRRDTCRTVLSRDGCPDGHICQRGQHGNLCVPLLARGASCSSDRSCLSDSCRAGRCYEDLCPTPLDSLGCGKSQICVHTLIGNECMTRLPLGAQCTSNLQCLTNICRDNHCRRPLAQNGDRCRADNDCLSRNCRRGTCRPPPAQDGDRCRSNKDCLSGNCFKGTCRPPGTGDGGSRCQSNGDCLLGLVCSRGICSQLGDDGDFCQANNDCLLGLVCISGICGETGGEGDICQLNSDCLLGLSCLNSFCVSTGAGDGAGGGDGGDGGTVDVDTLLDIGDQCFAGIECLSGRCAAGQCAEPLLGIGDDCSTAESMPSNALCRSNVCDATSLMCVRGSLTEGAICTDVQQCGGTCDLSEGFCKGGGPPVETSGAAASTE